MRADTKALGIRLYDLGGPGQGIIHVVGPELGITLPGVFLVCGDSHTCTHGGMGAIAFGIGSSEVAHVLATQVIVQRRPQRMRVNFEGKKSADVQAKDLILYLIGQIGTAGGSGYAVEYAGSAIEALEIEGRLTVCNLSIELGSKIGMIAPDDKTYSFIAGRPMAPQGAMFDAAVRDWRTLPSDPGAEFDREVDIDVSKIVPQITWGTSPEHVVGIDQPIPDPSKVSDPNRRKAMETALDYMGLAPGTPIAGTNVDWVFIGSCTNSRISDLRAARGHRQGPQGRRGRQRLGRAGVREREAAGRGGRPRHGVQGRRLSMAGGRLLDVRGDERRDGAAGPAQRLDQQPQLHRPPGARRSDPPGQPADGSRSRDSRQDRRRPYNLSCREIER